MPSWDYEHPYPGGAAVTSTPLPRPLYAKNSPSGKPKSVNGVDIQAAKRIISRLGRWPWSDNFSTEMTQDFAYGKAGGNVGDSGIAGYQRQMGFQDTGQVGTDTYNSWRNCRIPEGLPHAGEPAMDATAVKLMEQAYQQFKGQEPSAKPSGSLTRTWIASPNWSSRSGATVRLIVLHTAEGAKTYQALGNYFADPGIDASSHVGIDDTKGVIGEYVKRGNKAWTCANANPVSVNVELCAWADWSSAEWGKHDAMLDNLARWIAEEAAYFDIPIVALSPAQAQGTNWGVCQHKDLGSWGGGHSDCGPNFPMSSVLTAAKGYL